ncbi:MAG TPA: CBS domain-containing protein [Thermodesulfobacteriota bacterium]|nr:CBS domain-containing protein [Thermodesulfobacteriota bacterium]
MIASNIMTTGVVTLGHKSTMLDAIKLISVKQVRQIPVVDPSGRVVGVITPRKLMKAILPPYVADGTVADVRFAPELPEFVENIDSLASKSVDDILDKEFVSVGPETHSMEVAALFVNAKKPVESILVVDSGKRVLGIISPWDLFRRLWEYSERKK